MAKITFKTFNIQRGLKELRIYKDGNLYDIKINEPKNIPVLKKIYKKRL